MESELVSRTRLYLSEDDIKQDQEKVVDAVLDKYTAFDYLKADADLTSRVKKGSLEGLRKGIATFMEKNCIENMRDVFEHPHNFYHNEFTYEAIKNRLIGDAVLRNQWCDAERPSIIKDMFLKEGFSNKEDYLSDLFNYECEHIAEIIHCTYVNHILTKKLVKIGELPSLSLDDVDVPDEPKGFDE